MHAREADIAAENADATRPTPPPRLNKCLPGKSGKDGSLTAIIVTSLTSMSTHQMSTFTLEEFQLQKQSVVKKPNRA